MRLLEFSRYTANGSVKVLPWAPPKKQPAYTGTDASMLVRSFAAFEQREKRPECSLATLTQ